MATGDPLLGGVSGDGSALTGVAKITYLQASPYLVFDGTGPNSWTDLDLSSVIGSNLALVFLHILVPGADTWRFRMNGEGAEVGEGGTTYFTCTAARRGYILVKTDSSGIIEWLTANALAGSQVYLYAYII